MVFGSAAAEMCGADSESGHLNSNFPRNGGSSPVPPPPAVPPPASKPPRSARAAVEPERVPAPSRRSKRVRHPVVIVGNAIFTLLVVISVADGQDREDRLDRAGGP